MAVIDKIKRQSRIDVKEVIERLKKELNVTSDDGVEQIQYALYSTLQTILNTTNRDYLIEDMYSIWVDMTKDYWKLNGYDQKYKGEKVEDEETLNTKNPEIKSIKRGDTETTFMEKKSQTTINGITYQTGTIHYDEEVLINRYKTQLYRFRRLGRRRGW